MNLSDIITLERGKRGGKPCIRGMRITVYDVLSYLAAGMTQQEILSDFPYLTEEDILACYGYAPSASSAHWSPRRETSVRPEPRAASRDATCGPVPGFQPCLAVRP